MFRLESYSFVESTFRAVYEIRGEYGDATFTETIDFENVRPNRQPEESLLRLLALACSLSYYKASASTNITIAFPLTESELRFYRALIKGGLAEYAYRNDVRAKLSPTISAPQQILSGRSGAAWWSAAERPLVAVGGGKDSVVTIERLVKSGLRPILFSVNEFDPIQRCVDVSGCDYVTVSRKIDPLLSELNAEGAPNGHVPVTAINSLIALVTADIAGLGPVVMSNERSANSGNLDWDGVNVNHQWSKSLEFEDLLRDVLRSDGLESDRYFSLLRSLRELDIAREFATLPQYFSSFTSCNRVFKIDVKDRASNWCGVCPKCLFVFLILAPFVSRRTLVGIFGNDLLADESNQPLFEEILGLRGHKPFECVGEYDEAVEALNLLGSLSDWKGSAIVLSLAPQVAMIGPELSTFEDRVPRGFPGGEG